MEGKGFVVALQRGTVGEPKSPNYYRNVRVDLYEFATQRIELSGRVLNVGCGGGEDAAVLRDQGASYLEGVEPTVAAKNAAAQYDFVFEGRVEEYFPERGCDLVIFADVLEHLVDPGAILLRARKWLNPNGHLLISVPNVRHISVLWSLAVCGDWRYEEEGILDATHLRFFTRRSFRRLLCENGYVVLLEAFSGSSKASQRVVRLLPCAGHFLQSQLFFLATPSV